MNHAPVRFADFTLILLRSDKKNKDHYNVVAVLILYLITVGI
jgi:hypothetical protein